MDNFKKIISHLGIRIGILLSLFGLLVLYWNFIYDPHTLCDKYQHRHTDAGLGMFVLALFITFFFYFGLLIEIPFLRRKGNKSLANLNLVFILLSVFAVLGCIALLNLNR
ncbi:hypothetical protein [Flavobacterium sp. IB48]|uniref:hypothetical protein n=1 Tax=Flavobacterium sp. IB48 TaxID=2779375 RepID=UPI0018E89B45|nr:hypothetical protein [Flavobacterium sp. IB48]MBJ2123480.1 hypothetical protein [Flavobacterium sp. IB48]